MEKELIGPVWVTKDALTCGITKHSMAVWNRSIRDTMISIKEPGGVWALDHYFKPDWHLSEAEAMERAEELRNSKIDSVVKQLAKLRSMTFVVR